MTTIDLTITRDDVNVTVVLKQIDSSKDAPDSYSTRVLYFTTTEKIKVLGRSSTAVKRNLVPGVNNGWIASPIVSREHAYLKVLDSESGPEIVIEDNDSTHGTFVNGENIGKGARKVLHNGDRIRLGNEVIQPEATFKPPEYNFSIVESVDLLDDNDSVIYDHAISSEPIPNTQTEAAIVSDRQPSSADLDREYFGMPESEEDESADEADYTDYESEIESEAESDIDEPKTGDRSTPLSPQLGEEDGWSADNCSADDHSKIVTSLADQVLLDHMAMPAAFCDAPLDKATPLPDYESVPSPVFCPQSPNVHRYRDGPFTLQAADYPPPNIPVGFIKLSELTSQFEISKDHAIAAPKARNDMSIDSLIHAQNVAPSSGRPATALKQTTDDAEILTSPCTIGKKRNFNAAFFPGSDYDGNMDMNGLQDPWAEQYVVPDTFVLDQSVSPLRRKSNPKVIDRSSPASSTVVQVSKPDLLTDTKTSVPTSAKTTPSVISQEPARKKARLSAFLTGVAVGAIGGSVGLLGTLIALPENFFA